MSSIQTVTIQSLLLRMRQTISECRHAETHEVLADISYVGEPIKGFGFAGEDRLVVITSKRMVGFDTSDWGGSLER